MQRLLLLLFSFILVLLVSSTTPALWAASPPIVLTDSLYNAHHPRLLFTPGELPALRLKVSDGVGVDDLQYLFLQVLLDVVYKNATQDELLDIDFGQEAFANLGLTMYLPVPADTASERMGKQLTQYVADNWAVDTDAYHSALRLRALSLGYDMFFGNSDAAERGQIRDEIRSYLDYMLVNLNYDIWRHRPYLSNKAAMVAASMGLGAIVLDGDTDPAVVSAALQSADERFNIWLTHQVDRDGACLEGSLYGAWSLRNLIYFFHARLRYDGVNYADLPKLRKMEEWFAYELDPAGGARANNIHDSPANYLPLARHTTYFDWAQGMWNSGLAKYIWDHVAGSYGLNLGDQADKVGTILWSKPLVPVHPRGVLPPSKVWEERGLYYYRSDWPVGATSEDVVFSFYSGLFQGGHAQEDQNQFSLSAYGAKLVIDHGPGIKSKQSEAHNIVFVDGKGQHNAGSSIGTDGLLVEYVLGDFADYIMGDATLAYTTYSPFNNFGVPYPGWDWSWGYYGENPVNKAHRRIIAVHNPSTRPYFIVLDDIEKDGLVHDYEWRMHTSLDNTIDISAEPLRITSGNAYLDVHVMNPAFDSLTATTTFFDNQDDDPNSMYLSLSRTAVNPSFAFLLFPGDDSFTAPLINVSRTSFGTLAGIAWPDGRADLCLVNLSGVPLSTTISVPVGAAGVFGNIGKNGVGGATGGSLLTDARVSLLRFDGNQIEQYLLTNVTYLTLGGVDYVTVSDGPVNVTMSENRIHLDRPNADFRLLAPGITEVYYRDQRIWVVESGGYLTPSPATGIGDTPRPGRAFVVKAYPNPFNPVTRITVELSTRTIVSAAIYDVTGRRVRRLWSGELVAGVSSLDWDGRDDRGNTVASGVYLLRVAAGSNIQTLKLTLLK